MYGGIFFKSYPVLLQRIFKNFNNELSRRSAVDLAYKVHGSNSGANTILVLHGLLGSKKNWESMSKRIAEATKSTVVVADARNHGESPHTNTHTYFDLASDVHQLMEKLSLNEATIIGHSMGGRTAMVLALTKPSKVKKLVIVDISPISTPGIMNNFFPRLIEAMKTVTFESSANASVARASAKQQLESTGIVDNVETLNFVVMNVGRRPDNTIGWVINLDVLKDAFLDMANFPRSELAGRHYSGPVLFIAGQESNYVAPSDITGIRQFFPKANLKYIPNSGHNVYVEDPDVFFSTVMEFISQN